MTVTVVDGAIILGFVALLAAFVAGLFVGARLARSAGGSPASHPAVKAEAADLVLQLLREVVSVVRELRSSQAAEPEQPELPHTRRKAWRPGSRSTTISASRKEG